MTMGARLRRRSPPPLLRQPSSESQSTSAFPSYDPPAPTPRSGPPIISLKRASGLACVVACFWLAGFIAVSLHRDEPSEHHRLLPIPPSTVRGKNFTRHASLYRQKHRHHAKEMLPKHYFQLSPPAIATEGEDSSPPPPWSWPIIHVVSTRFMQGQGSLVNLARSRLKLLEAVCLPSLMKQTMFDHDRLSEVYERTKWEEEVRELNGHQPKIVTDPLFLWIIKVDPDIDRTVLNELKAILEPAKRFTLVVGSNTNYGIGIKPGGWRDGQAGRDILDAYDNGRAFFPEGANVHVRRMLRRAHEARSDRVVIETRLDADDAVNVDYLAALQTTALRTLMDANVSGYDDGGNRENAGDALGDAPEEQNEQIDAGDGSEEENKQIQTARWLYWCPLAHVQWNPSSSADGPDDPGALQVFQMPMMCVTAGLSLGFAVGTTEEHVPRYEHSKVYWEIAVHHNNENATHQQGAAIEFDKHHCGLHPSKNCAVFVKNPMYAAFRSRAMTSAGMHNIEAQGAPSRETPAEYKARAAKLWKGTIEREFGIRTKKAKEAADFMLANRLGTARDNLRGQCTHGHSCKVSSLEKLQMTIDILEEETGGVEWHG